MMKSGRYETEFRRRAALSRRPRLLAWRLTIGRQQKKTAGDDPAALMREAR